jgi:hypothetical protein
LLGLLDERLIRLDLALIGLDGIVGASESRQEERQN